ncbi:MAG: hypothetical protein ABIN97_20495 [Ginsengibacter sp.]
MKLSSIILLVTFLLLVTAMFASNILLKKEYDKIDKNDNYWTYGKILQQPFKHLKIEGGNVTRIAYEQSKSYSVRVAKDWYGYEKGLVKTYVKNDTLFLKFPNTYKDHYEKSWLEWNTLVRIFSPELLSVDGFDTNFQLFKLRQKSININLSGRSRLEVESYNNDLDSLHINQKDSSEVIFEMSPDLKGQVFPHPGLKDSDTSKADQDIKSNSWETMYIKRVDANVQGVSLLNLGHAQINFLQLNISDTSAIILSGRSLGKLKR